MKRPSENEFPPYYKYYVDLIKGHSAIKALENQILDVQSLISDIPSEREDYAYAEGKWTIKEVLGHVIDTERILAYRALRFARNDNTELSGFDENKIIQYGNFNKRSLYDLAHEFGVVRESNIILFKHFDEEALERRGIANGREVSVRALIYFIGGHQIHHTNVIKEKYLDGVLSY